MMGAPEIISLNGLLIKSLAARKVIDVGVFTGASSLAAALALPEGLNLRILSPQSNTWSGGRWRGGCL